MVFSSQSFRAPSISRPKMGKSTVSSSVMSGANTPKINKTTVSSSVFSPVNQTPSLTAIKGSYSSIFKGSNVDPKYLPQKPTGVEQSLVETNNILVEIQNQLAIDFATRIAEREDALKAFRKQSENARRSRKEGSLEGLSSFGRKASNIVSSVAKPFKSIFSRIFEFLSILATGFLANAAIKWLSDEENRKKLLNVFNFLADNWKIFAGLLVGGLALKALYKIIRLASGVRKILQALRILPRRNAGGGPTTGGESPRRGGLIRNAAGQRRGFTTSRLLRNGIPQTRVTGGYRGVAVSQFTRQKGAVAKAVQFAEVLTAKAGRDILKRIGLGPGARGILGFLRPIFKRIPIFGALIDFAVSLALGEPIGRAAAKAVGAALGGALGSLIPIPGVGTVAGGILGDFVGGKIYDAMTGGEQKEKMALGGKIKGKSHSSGGVDINAEGGEYIVNKRDTMRFEPVLADMNYNGGRLWEEFSKGVVAQTSQTKLAFETSTKMGELLTDFEEVLRMQKEKESAKTLFGIGGGQSKPGSFAHGGDIPMPMDDHKNIKNVAPVMVPIPNLTKPKTKRNTNMVQLPPVVMNSNSPMPSINTGDDKKTIPSILPYDSANEYLNISARSYDIIGLRFGG
jgi:hypothetical protein